MARAPVAVAAVAATIAMAALIGAVLLLAPAAQDPGPEVVIEMTAQRYSYAPGNLTVQQGTTVVIRIQSIDVTHGFAITEFGIQTTIPPGETVEVRFKADRQGIFEFFCTVFCGSGHPEHRGKLAVVA